MLRNHLSIYNIAYLLYNIRIIILRAPLTNKESMNPKIYIVVLNYNTWQDTAECLESLYKSRYNNYQVILVDNKSNNDSVKFLKMWAEGGLDVVTKGNNTLKRNSFPPVKKPLGYYFYKEDDEGNLKYEYKECINESNKAEEYPLIVIKANKNKGFSAGNNIGIKYALLNGDFEYIWLLNNDTVIDNYSLDKLVEKADSYDKQKAKVGIIGSKVLFYNNPNIIQGVGVKYNKWLGTSKHIGIFEEDKGRYNNEESIFITDYIMGSSMFVNKKFINDVGLLCEDYFLYFEELDWILRGKQKGWNIGYCWESKVYHKEGATMGSNANGKLRSEQADYYTFKNRIVFTKKFFPKYIWTVYAGFFMVALNRLSRRQFKRLKIIWSVLTSS